MKILALDIATNVGLAIGDGVPASTLAGTMSLRNHAHDLGAMSAAFSIWLADKITRYEPELIAIERGFFRGPQSYHLSGLIWDAHRIAHLREVPRVEYAPLTIKKFITGNARADKRRVIGEIARRGYYVANDHEADAIALLLLARERAEERKAA